MLPSIINSILQNGFGPFIKQANPQLYYFVLGALAIAVVLGVVNFLVAALRRDSDQTLFGVLIGEVVILIIQALSIGLIWFAFATPYKQIPLVAPPLAGAHWSIVPLDSAYYWVAVILHGVASYIGVQALVAAWLVQLHSPDESRTDGLGFFAGLALLVFGWEAQHWPLLFLILAELFVNTALARSLTSALFSSRPQRVTRAQIQRCFYIGFQILGLGAIWTQHDVTLYPIILFGIYSALVPLDDLIACIRAAIRPTYFKDDPFGILTDPNRWIVTTLCILVVAFLGASGLFTSFIANPGITYTIWVEAGVTATAYMLFRPLTEDARARILGELIGRIKQQYGPLLDAIFGEEESPDQRGAPLSASQELLTQLSEDVEAAWSTFSRLRFPAFVFLLIGAYIFHLIIAYQNLSSLLNMYLVHNIFSILGFTGNSVAAAYQRRKVLSPATDSMTLIRYITYAAAVVNLLIVAVPGANGTLSLSGVPPLTLLTDTHFLLVTVHYFILQMTLLLIFGLIAYLLQVLNAARQMRNGLSG